MEPKLKKKSEVIAEMYAGAVMAGIELEVGITLKKSMILTMVHDSEKDIRGKIQIQIAKEEAQLEQQQRLVRITKNLFEEAVKNGE